MALGTQQLACCRALTCVALALQGSLLALSGSLLTLCVSFALALHSQEQRIRYEKNKLEAAHKER
jgi:hypothetical protein